VVAAAGALLALAACASSPRPVPEVAAARALISQAEQSNAQQFASSDLEAARSKLRQADQDERDNKPVLAAQVATESTVDAEVAMARTRAMKAEQAVSEVNAGNRTLSHETQRQDTPPSSVIVVTPGSSATVVQPQ